MMKLNDHEKAEIERLAACFMSIKDIGEFLGANPDEFKTQAMMPGSDIYLAIKRGEITTKSKVHESIFSQAAKGLAPAQTLAVKIMDDQKLDDIING